MNEIAEQLRAELAATRRELDTVLSDLAEERAARDAADALTEEAQRQVDEVLAVIDSALASLAVAAVYIDRVDAYGDDLPRVAKAIESAVDVLRFVAGEATE